MQIIHHQTICALIKAYKAETRRKSGVWLRSFHVWDGPWWMTEKEFHIYKPASQGAGTKPQTCKK